ncbi:cytochrome c biogenesis protein CcdA [Leucobacter sp. UCMA 4100]|uniref:cytochrome c biogenesis CcdA family protein n=1 Tax=Leucobacter sp. UCMA 4100 TaxID=2810534 RepID=UPI0022EB0484|nr:cytochrome c biogenesis CcdA family protein [Leucobacter sp. UCMA 4100]MDA3147499.1 cytochrome c biogenesis protein CcdA [Leucobacter sp. UCMA 4100]
MSIGYLTAFLGGVLALLSPCSALLLPAFFASTVGTKLRLLVHGAVFYLGLVLTLVPFGLGAGALGSVLMQRRGLVIAGTSLVLIVLGVMQLFGYGFDLARVLPGAGRLQQRATKRSGLVRTLLLGSVSGVAGFCAGPILGAVLTLAMGQGSAFTAGALLAVYGAGMVVPLVIIAALWERMGSRGQRLLRGRGFTLWGRQWHTTQVITGFVIIAVGVLFWLTNGLVSLPSLVPTSVQAWAGEKGAALGGPVFDAIAVVLLATGALLAWWFMRHRREREPEGESSNATR